MNSKTVTLLMEKTAGMRIIIFDQTASGMSLAPLDT
jgi:hypothetical protein